MRFNGLTADHAYLAGYIAKECPDVSPFVYRLTQATRRPARAGASVQLRLSGTYEGDSRPVCIDKMLADIERKTAASLMRQVPNQMTPMAAFEADPVDAINNLLQDAWNEGTRDLDTLVVDSLWAGILAKVDAPMVLRDVEQEEGAGTQTVMATDFFSLVLVKARDMQPWSLIATHSGLIRVAASEPPVFERKGDGHALHAGYEVVITTARKMRSLCAVWS